MTVNSDVSSQSLKSELIEINYATIETLSKNLSNWSKKFEGDQHQTLELDFIKSTVKDYVLQLLAMQT